ncbi:MAG TPA: hypothetical protein VL175_09815 [Pirellulales bacterium]|nr:hypothetical protein [Pirellulales bacterium]
MSRGAVWRAGFACAVACVAIAASTEAGPPFLVRAEFPLAECADLLDDLGEIQKQLTTTLRLPSAREPVHIVLFRDEATYREYGKTHFPRVAYRRALYVKRAGAGTVYAFRGPELAVDLRHEATHGVLHASLPMVPLWLDEGLAEYFEVPPAARISANPHLKSVKWNLRLGAVPRLARLEARQDVSDMNAGDYRDAWAWVHFLLNGPPEAHDELVRFLDDIARGAAAGQLSRRLESRLGGAEVRLAEHFKGF